MDASASSREHADLNKVCSYFQQNTQSEISAPRQKNTTVKYTRLPDYDFDARVVKSNQGVVPLPKLLYLQHHQRGHLKGNKDTHLLTRNNIDPTCCHSLHLCEVAQLTDDWTNGFTWLPNHVPMLFFRPTMTGVSWPQTDSYILHPRLRRIVAVEDQEMFATRSLKHDIPINIMSSTVSKRKFVTITEDDENDYGNRYSKDTKPVKKPPPRNLLHKSVETVRTPERLSANKTTKSTSLRENKPSTVNEPVMKPKVIKKSEVTRGNYKSRQECLKYLDVQEKETEETPRSKRVKSPNAPQKTCISRKVEPPSKSVEQTKNKLTDSMKTNVSNALAKSRTKSGVVTPIPKTRPKAIKDIKAKPVTVIHVPLDANYTKQKGTETEIKHDFPKASSEDVPENAGILKASTVDKGLQIHSEPEKVDRMTYTDTEDIHISTAPEKIDRYSQIDLTKEIFYDSLDIPNVTLMKDISDVPKNNCNINSQSLPNVNSAAIKIISSKGEITNIDEKPLCKSTSFIIGRATVTYTTRQKIDFHVVGQKDEMLPRVSASPLAYPLNVVSVFRKEISKHREISDGANVNNTHKKDESEAECVTNADSKEVKSVNCSYSNSGKLVKPSDVISTIRLDDGLMQNDFMCEQFQSELNFIDSFFESLQYLESCSLSGQGFSGSTVENCFGFDVRNAQYDCYFPKTDNDADMNDTETIAAKSLCLLNLLIRDEQRRAKNLLFVLKMREDALKDFTKSQILWLENKKKRDNIDIPTLKKKQRGALLKLQHECGEMQRMRKALLTLSEKRRVALLKTKKNIELKLNNNVNLSEILNKKKIKRNKVSDRHNAPLKCFDLSSSGCDESGPTRSRSDSAVVARPAPCAEKSIQTGESLLERHLVDDTTDTGTEHFIGVDGGYLNILFGNLGLPQIFSGGKPYEVNEEALRNIVNSTNKHHEVDFVEKFIDQIKCRDLERASTPSTARSLVDEYDMYYKGLVEEEKYETDDENANEKNLPEHFCAETQVTRFEFVDTQSCTTMATNSTATMTNTSSQFEEVLQECGVQAHAPMVGAETQALRGMDSASTGVQSGPLPVPAGAAAEPDPAPLHSATHKSSEHTLALKASSDTASLIGEWSAPLLTDSPSAPLVSALSAATSASASAAASASASASGHSEAEELRRQQLAIEREIKALEQQQSQLLVVREIPDKPPPPYTPPVETRAHLPRKFIADDTLEQRVQEHITHPTGSETTDSLDTFIKDFCMEMVRNAQEEQSDRPWDACNLQPQKRPVDMETLVDRTVSQLKDVLTALPASGTGGCVGGTGAGARRSDHVDEILFAEWRRCEPAWIALHEDETDVKNQLFETIFQRVLSETVDEYKRTVLTRSDNHASDSQEDETNHSEECLF